MIRQRGLLLCILSLGLLAGCSRSSLITLDVDALSFMAPAMREGRLSVADAALLLPDADGIASSDLGLSLEVLRELQRFETQVAATLSLENATSDATVTLSLHISPDGSSSPFDAPPVTETTARLSPGEAVPVVFDVLISEAENAGTLATLRDGHFRLGVRLALDSGSTASELHYTLETLQLTASMRAAGVLPF